MFKCVHRWAMFSVFYCQPLSLLTFAFPPFFLCFQVSSSPWLPVLPFSPCLSSCCSIRPPDLSSVWSVHPPLLFDGCPDAPSATLWQQRDTAQLSSFSCSLFVWMSFYSFFQPALLISDNLCSLEVCCSLNTHTPTYFAKMVNALFCCAWLSATLIYIFIYVP